MRRFKIDAQTEELFWESCFLIVFGVLLSKRFLETTQVYTSIITQYGIQRTSYYLWIRLAAVTVVLARLVRSKRYRFSELVLSGIVLVCFWRCFQVTEYEEILDLMIVVLGARGVSYQKILKVYTAVTALLIVFVFALTGAGVIEDWIFPVRSGGEQIAKHSFGFLYPNELGAHIFFLCLSYVLLRGKKIRVPEILVILLLAGFLAIFCRSRTNVICLILLAAGALIFKISNRIPGIYERKGAKIAGISLALVPFLCCAVMLLLTVFYTEESEWMTSLNSLLSNRLSIGHRGFENYGVTRFGQWIEMVGMSLTTDWANYNFLDCSYVMLLIRCGAASFLSVMLLIAVSDIRAFRRRDFVFLFVMALCGIQCIMEHHLYDIAYNPLLLAALANFPEKAGNTVLRSEEGNTETAKPESENGSF